MRSKVVRTLALALLLVGAAAGLAQQSTKKPRAEEEEQAAPRVKQQAKKAHAEEEEGLRAQRKTLPEKSKLEEMLAEALKNNPDIRVAAAKMAEAEAELNRTRVQVTQKIVALNAAIARQKAEVAYRQKEHERYKGLFADRAIDLKLLEEVQDKLTLAKAQLEEVEAQIPALLGRSSHSEANAETVRALAADWLRAMGQPKDTIVLDHARRLLLATRESADQHKATGPMAERLRKALQTPVKVNFKDVTFDEILSGLSKMVEGLSFRNLFERRGSGHFELPKRSLQFEEAMPVSAILQALEDETDCRFFVREYGILATTKDGTPHGAMTVEEFLRYKPADESRPQSRGGRNPPAESVEGLVKNVDASGLMTLNLGSNAGLSKGHTLELFRPDPSAPSQSKYLGTVRILEAEAHQSVAQPVGRLSSPPQRGDRVASRMLGN